VTPCRGSCGCVPPFTSLQRSSKLSFELPLEMKEGEDIKIDGMMSGLKVRQLAILLLKLLDGSGRTYDAAVDKLIGLLFWSGACALKGAL
jgi:hypothetical protein